MSASRHKANHMKKIKADEKGIKPTFVVDVNEKCSEKELMAILIELKILVADRNLANGVVVLSTSFRRKGSTSNNLAK